VAERGRVNKPTNAKKKSRRRKAVCKEQNETPHPKPFFFFLLITRDPSEQRRKPASAEGPAIYITQSNAKDDPDTIATTVLFLA